MTDPSDNPLPPRVRRITVGKVLKALRTPVTLLVLLAALGYAAWWGYTNVTAPIPPAPREPCVPQSVEDGKMTAEQVTLRVLNGGSQRGLAGEVADDLRENGFRVSRVDNLDRADDEPETEGTIIVVQDKDNPEAKLVAAFFTDATFKEEPERIDHSVDVIVGNDFGGFDDEAAASIKVKASTVCLPALPTPTAGAAGDGEASEDSDDDAEG